MEWVKRQSSRDKADMAAYAVLRAFANYPSLDPPPILSGRHANRFDCSTAYRPALDAVKQGDLMTAISIMEAAGVFESDEQPPDWCYE